MPSPQPPLSAGAPADARASRDLEVVCRTQSADTEPTGGNPSYDPIPAPSLDKAHRGNKGGNKGKVFPADTPTIEDNVANTNKSGFVGKSSAAAFVHVNASAAGGINNAPAPPPISRSSSVFDMLDYRRKRKRAPWKVKVGAFLDGITFTIISIIFTVLVS